MAENEKLECLRKLQDVLQEKFSLEQQVESLPADLKREESTLKAVEAEYEELQNLTEAAIQDVKSLSIQYEDAFQQRTTYEKQMEFLSTQREYEALSKQLEEAKVAEHTLLKQRNSRTKESEKLKKDTEAKAAEVEAQKAKVEEERTKVDTQLSGIQSKIAELEEKCQEIKNGTISDELYAKFSNSSSSISDRSRSTMKSIIVLTARESSGMNHLIQRPRRTIYSNSLSPEVQSPRALIRKALRRVILTMSLWAWTADSRISDKFQVPEVIAGNRGKSGLHRTMVLANGQEQ